MLDRVTIDVTSNFQLVLAYDQLPVPCGVHFYMERTGSAGGNPDPFWFAIVVEEN